jgi:hypothetical protein
MSSGPRVEVDTRKLDAGLRQLTRGVDRGIGPVAGRNANTVADRLRPLVPVRTGRLRNTVRAERRGDTGLVHYGGTLPYAGYIDGRTDATARALDGAPESFHDDMRALGAREVGRL